MAVAPKKKKSGGTKPRNVVAQARSGGTASRKDTYREWLRTLIGAVVIFLVLRTFFIEAYHIPSGSMEPTLLVGDFLFANNTVFGPHIPFTNYNLPGVRDPRRGEVVVYESPSQARLTEGRIKGELTPTVVKRLMGTPGDTLYMRDGMLYVNGIAQRQGFGMGEKPFGYVDDTDANFSWQKAFGLKASRFGAAPAEPTHDNWGPFVIPPKHYFSLGDNRYNSIDARYYGFIPRANIRAKPMFIYMSFDFDDLRVRWSRIFKIIR
ncbi:MAG TPA: signal peptidase I [Gemmatimonadaceae bacterium]|jgi:signal peptidase I